MTGAVLVTDPDWAASIIADRAATDGDRWTEVWDGITVIPPLPDNDQREIVTWLTVAFFHAVRRDGGDVVYPGVNVSDRVEGWLENYSIPDVAVTLAGGPSRDCDTHLLGGPDVVVEIACRGEVPRQKLDFYAKVGSRELLVIDRYPWALELYQLRRGKLRLSGRSDPANPTVLASTVLPLTFQLRDGEPRPVVVVTHTGTGQTWTA